VYTKNRSIEIGSFRTSNVIINDAAISTQLKKTNFLEYGYSSAFSEFKNRFPLKVMVFFVDKSIPPDL